MYKNFDDWESYEGFSCGSGTSNQEWIINNETNEIALFKERKTDSTTDNFSEKIASDIANVINLPCAKIDLAVRNNKIGLVSYLINSPGETLLEGVIYLSKKYPYYNRNDLIDDLSGKKYSFEMIMESIKDLEIEKDLFKIFIFDCLIGNSDRHHSNWAIINKNGNNKVCPIYDNASSLGAYLEDKRIKESFKDNKWLNAQVDTKSKSRIHLEGKKVTHCQFIKYLRDYYYDETIDFIKEIKYKLKEDKIEYIIDRYKGILSTYKIMFLKEFLKRKRILILRVYDLET
ncbi:MAG: HipA domain-containing protein [Clostridium sp.]|nr:HipA domain-containing protein [Clostridium sp.]